MKVSKNKVSDNKSLKPPRKSAFPSDGVARVAQFKDNRGEASQLQELQGIANQSTQVSTLSQLQAMTKNSKPQELIQKKKNTTGLPDDLKSGIENLSGMAMDDVNVHRNSDKPAQLNAHAYAQGTDIHLASGQEKHLPHEAWHVVQQKQGRVKPSFQMKERSNINGDKATQLKPSDQKFYEDFGLVLQAKWAMGVTQLVLFDGVDVQYSPMNEQILKDALDAILEVQDSSNGFLEWCEELIEKTEADGVPAHAQEISAFYASTKETWFSVNPILKEAWRRCIASTRKIASKSKYHKVGGKFKRKLEQLLLEIEEDFIALSDEVDNVQTAYINKEHIENKGLGGPQVQSDNLMDAGVGPKGLGMGNGTLSEFHVALHRLKSQGGSLFNSMDVDIRSIVQSVKGASSGHEMGDFN